MSPDGRYVAVRFGTPEALTPPAVYDTETDKTSFMVSDRESRRAWLTELALSTRRLLKAALPPAGQDQNIGSRPTILPLPGELPVDGLGHRVRRLARCGTALFPQSLDHAEDDDAPEDQAILEARLAFHYLVGDFAQAASELPLLEPLLSRPADRFGLLSLRAQILWSRGETAEARAVIDYLVSATGAHTQHVDDTPLGLILTPYVSPDHAWAHYLAKKAALHPGPSSLPNVAPEVDAADPALLNPFGAPDPPIPDRAAAPPFAPG